VTAGAPTFENFKPSAGNPRRIDIKDMLEGFGPGRHQLGSGRPQARARWPHKPIGQGRGTRRTPNALPAWAPMGVVVSNHGGRHLASAPSSIEAPPAIRQAVGPDFAVLLDSGVRSGDDIAKALAAGADFVWLGRTFLDGTGGAGAERGPAVTIRHPAR